MSTNRHLAGSFRGLIRPPGTGAAIHGAEITPHAHPASSTAREAFGPFQNQLADHGYERWMDSHGCGAKEIDTQYPAQSGDFLIQVVNDLHVVAQEPDRHNHQVLQAAFGVKLADG